MESTLDLKRSRKHKVVTSSPNTLYLDFIRYRSFVLLVCFLKQKISS